MSKITELKANKRPTNIVKASNAHAQIINQCQFSSHGALTLSFTTVAKRDLMDDAEAGNYWAALKSA